MDISAIRAFAIKEGAAEESLVKRPLTWDEFSTMGSAESHWHCVANSKAVDAVHEAHSREVGELKSLTKKQIEEVFNHTDLSHPAVRNTVENFDVFIAKYPQYVHLPIHVTDIIFWLRKNSMLPEADNIATAWKALVRDGAMPINGAATGLVDEVELTGKALQFHPQLNALLLPVTPTLALERRVRRMSDEEFKRWDREQHGPKGLPWIIDQRIKQAFTTLAANHPEFRMNDDENKTKLLEHIRKYARTIDAQSVEAAFVALKSAGELNLNDNVIVETSNQTKWIDYSQVEPKHLTDRQESLSDKIARMNAAEFAEFISKPVNRRAVDHL